MNSRMIDNLHSLLVDPSSLDEVSVSELEGLITEFPAVGLFKVLLAKKMNRSETENLINQVNDPVMISMYMDEASRAGIISVGQLVSESHEPTAKHEENNLIDVADEIGEVTSNSSGDENVLDTVQNESNKVESYIINDSVTHHEVLVPEIVNEQNVNVSAILLEEPVSFLDDKTSEIIQTDIGESEDIVPSKKNKAKVKKHKSTTTKSKDLIGMSDYGQWLMKFKDQEIQAKIEKAARKAEKRKQKDKIKENAMLSVTKSTQIISEPLANILAAQGHLDEAKKMFEQLMLRNPEKSSYFAAQINNLIKFLDK